jgi:equilibrative nucleoside transporter 1/2/3
MTKRIAERVLSPYQVFVSFIHFAQKVAMEVEHEEGLENSRIELLGNTVDAPQYLNYIYGCIFTVFGLTMLSPWNTLIQLTDYFKVRLRDSNFAGNFEGYITITFQVFNILSFLVFLAYPKLLPQQPRLYTGFALVITTFVVLALLSLWTDLHPNVYFLLNLALVAFASIASACLGQIMGLAAAYPWFSIIAVNSGQGIAGLVPPLIQLIEQRKQGTDQADSIILKAVATIMYALIASASYTFLVRYDRFRPQSSLELPEPSMDLNAQSAIRIARAIRYPILSVFLNMAITLSIFPSITAYVAPQGNMTNFVLLHFITYNFFDWVGKTISLWSLFALKSERTVYTLTLSRLVFIPLILVSNVVLYNKQSQPYPQVFPVWIPDSLFFVVMALFAFTNGWLTTLCFMQAPAICGSNWNDGQAQSITADLMVLGLALGLATGGILTFLITAISCQCNPF